MLDYAQSNGARIEIDQIQGFEEGAKRKTYLKTLVCSFVFEMRHPTNKFDERTMVDYNNLLITFQTTWSPQLCLAQ